MHLRDRRASCATRQLYTSIAEAPVRKSIAENVHEVRVAKAVAAAKRDLIQSLKPHLDALEQGVALLRGDAERRDASPMADRPKP